MSSELDNDLEPIIIGDVLTTMMDRWVRLSSRRCPECDKQITPDDAYGHDCE